MSDEMFTLPDGELATIDALLDDLGLMEEPGRRKAGVNVDPIKNMVAIPAVLDKDGKTIIPAVMHKGGHMNLRLSGQVAKDDVIAPTRDRPEGGSVIRDFMAAKGAVKNYTVQTRPTTVRDAPLVATLLESVEYPQRGWM